MKNYLRIFSAFLLAGILSWPFAVADAPVPYYPSTVMVSMGDSYSAGEGIPPYYGQQNALGLDRSVQEKMTSQDFLSHRSTRSWSSRLKLPDLEGPMRDYWNKNWFFVASTGATTHTAKYGKNYDVYRVGFKLIDIPVQAWDLLLDSFLSDVSGSESQPAAVKIENTLSGLLGPLSLSIYSASNDELDALNKEQLDNGEPVTALIDSQFNILYDLKKKGTHVDYITLTMGGNDVGFVPILEQVFRSNDLDALREKLNAARTLMAIYPDDTGKYVPESPDVENNEVNQTYCDIYHFYKEILDICRDADQPGFAETQVIVAGYPRLLATEIDGTLHLNPLDYLKDIVFQFWNPFVALKPVDSFISDMISRFLTPDSDLTYHIGQKLIDPKEAEEVNAAVVDFNAALEAIVHRLNSENYHNIHFVDVAGEFKGHEAYSEEPYINPGIFVARSQDTTLLTPTSAASMHPNEQGVEKYAQCVQKKIDELEALKKCRYALNRLMGDGAWYEGAIDRVVCEADGIECESADVYDARVAADDSGNMTFSGEGYRYNYRTDQSVRYRFSQDHGSADFDYAFFDYNWEEYVYDEAFSASRPESGNSRWPERIPFDVFQPDFFSSAVALEIGPYSVDLELSPDQVKALGLDIRSILDKWNSDPSARGFYPEMSPLYYSFRTGMDAGYWSESEDSMTPDDLWVQYMVCGNDYGVDRDSAILQTRSVKMEVDFREDMSFDSVRFVTVGDFNADHRIPGLDSMTIRRELLFLPDDAETRAVYLYLDWAGNGDPYFVPYPLDVQWNPSGDISDPAVSGAPENAEIRMIPDNLEIDFDADMWEWGMNGWRFYLYDGSDEPIFTGGYPEPSEILVFPDQITYAGKVYPLSRAFQAEGGYAGLMVFYETSSGHDPEVLVIPDTYTSIEYIGVNETLRYISLPANDDAYNLGRRADSLIRGQRVTWLVVEGSAAHQGLVDAGITDYLFRDEYRRYCDLTEDGIWLFSPERFDSAIESMPGPGKR